MFQWLRDSVIWLCKWGEPSVVVSAGYLNRWHIIPRNPYFNIYFHEFIGSDDDRALHDHPWNSLSWVLRGKYIEYIDVTEEFDDEPSLQAGGLMRFVEVCDKQAGNLIYRKATHLHRIELLNDKPVYTLFINWNKHRDWGFQCPNKGWIHWTEFCKQREDGTMKGCE